MCANKVNILGGHFHIQKAVLTTHHLYTTTMNQLYDIMYRYPGSLHFECNLNLDLTERILQLQGNRINATASVDKKGQGELVLSYDNGTFVCISFDINRPKDLYVKYHKVSGFVSKLLIGDETRYLIHKEDNPDGILMSKSPSKRDVSFIYPLSSINETVLIVCDFRTHLLLLRDAFYSKLVLFSLKDNGKVDKKVFELQLPQNHRLIHAKLCGIDYTNVMHPFIMILYEDEKVQTQYKVCSFDKERTTFSFDCPLKTTLFTLDDDNNLIYIDENDHVCFCIVSKVGIPNASPKTNFQRRAFAKPRCILPGKILDLSIGPFRNVIQIITENQFLVDTVQRCEPSYNSDDEL